ncbi:hypothetical protein EGW08_008967 [Elysia chlorotica]|uniref:Uncharacterized protein n=1 Tax=Elysia chlorotica TaxID=188477 RepID=A0A433TNY8_ELYCH|nr:hypothetical protein EGW08_008967 [Elysia chlorotica]
MDGTMSIKRSSSCSSLSDEEDSPRGDTPSSAVENSPSPSSSAAHNNSGGSSSTSEYHSPNRNLQNMQNLPQSRIVYSRSSSTTSSGTYYAPHYVSSDSSTGPSPTKLPRRDGPPASSSSGGVGASGGSGGSGGDSGAGNSGYSQSQRQTESTLHGLYIPSITVGRGGPGIEHRLPTQKVQVRALAIALPTGWKLVLGPGYDIELILVLDMKQLTKSLRDKVDQNECQELGGVV